MSSFVGEIQTPVDQATGVPYVLVPLPELPSIPADGKNSLRVADWHHPFHPRASLVNQGSGLEALRVVRKQWALYNQHHNNNPAGYHSVYGGPPLPDTEEGQFRTIVFAAAGFIPDLAIDFQRAEDYRFRPLTDEERLRLWKKQLIRIDNVAKVRDFLITYAVTRDFVDDTSSVVDEFLRTRNRDRRVQLGNSLLKAAAYEAAQPLSPTYRQAKRDTLIHPALAPSAGQFVLRSIRLSGGVDRARQRLRQRLEAA